MQAMPTRHEALVSRQVDGWLVGGAAVALWLALEAHRIAHSPAIPAVTGSLTWALLTVTAAHFGISYHLAYADGGPAARRHRLALHVVPVAIGALVLTAWVLGRGAVVAVTMGVMLTVVFTLTVWHYAKQAFGVAVLGATLSGFAIRPASRRLLRYGLHPLWALSLVGLFTRGQDATMFGFRVGLGLLPPVADRVARAAFLISLAVLVVAFVWISVRARRRVPSVVWTPYVAGAVWIGFSPNYASAALVLTAAHGLQYLACVFRAERTWAGSRSQEAPNLWLLCIFAAAATGGLFATNWLAPLLSSATAGARSTSLFAAGLFAFLNLHHYAMDAVMWRSDGAHVLRMLRRQAPVPAVKARPSLAV